MEIKTTNENGKTLVKVIGRLDTSTAPSLESELSSIQEGSLELDFSELEYISSSGLRVLLSSYKKLGDKFVVTNVNDEIYEILEITGFDSILNIEKSK